MRRDGGAFVVDAVVRGFRGGWAGLFWLTAGALSVRSGLADTGVGNWFGPSVRLRWSGPVVLPGLTGTKRRAEPGDPCGVAKGPETEALLAFFMFDCGVAGVSCSRCC